MNTKYSYEEALEFAKTNPFESLKGISNEEKKERLTAVAILDIVQSTNPMGNFLVGLILGRKVSIIENEDFYDYNNAVVDFTDDKKAQYALLKFIDEKVKKGVDVKQFSTLEDVIETAKKEFQEGKRKHADS